MPDILGATNPVPGYDSSITNRNLPVSPDNTQIQNVADPNRVVGPDRRSEQQDSGSQSDLGQIRYDSNYQAFLQRLRESPNLAASLSRLFIGREGTVVMSGLSEGIAAELSKALEMLKLDQGQLLSFLTGQVRSGTRFSGALFALLRNAYAKAGSEGVRTDILNFLKSYSDYSSSAHVEGNLLRNLRGMADSIPARWADQLRELTAQLENSIAAGDRQGSLTLIQQRVIPFMSAYVSQTHDLGSARAMLSLLALDVARYENGSESRLLELFHQLSGYGTLRDQLGGIDDASLLALLQNGQSKATAATQFADHLTAAASRALRGEGNAEVQEIFQQLVNAMLINESVYMPINHFIIPLEMEGRLLFSELWVDPDAQEKNGKGGGRGSASKFLFKMDVQSLGLFDVVILSRDRDVNLRISCPEKLAPFSKEIEEAMADILARNGLNPAGVSVGKMERPVTLTEVFPKIFEGKNSVNVKV